MERRKFLKLFPALATAPLWLQKAVVEAHDPRVGQTVVFYTNYHTEEKPDPQTYQFYENGWNPFAFEISKSRWRDKGIELHLSESDRHSTVKRGMLAVFQDEEVGFVSDVARGFPRDFQCIVTITPLNSKS